MKNLTATSDVGEAEKAGASWIAWAALTLFSLLIVSLIIGAPLAEAAGHPRLAARIYYAFSFVCHQLPDRSFHLDGHKFAVCSRCTGLYSGFALATLCYPLVRSISSTDTPARRWLLLAVMPLVIDFSLTYFGIWQNTQLTRFVTGALLGAVAVFYIVPGLVQLSRAVRNSAKGH